MSVISSPQTRWTLIPRGIDVSNPNKPMQFTVVVSPAMYTTSPNAIPANTQLETTVWATWYRTIADLVQAVESSNKNLFFTLHSDASKQALGLKLQSKPGSDKRQPNSSNTDDPTWSALWMDLTRTFPDHLDADSPATESAPAAPNTVNAQVSQGAQTSVNGQKSQAEAADEVAVGLPTHAGRQSAPTAGGQRVALARQSSLTSYSIQPDMFLHHRGLTLLAEAASKSYAFPSENDDGAASSATQPAPQPPPPQQPPPPAQGEPTPPPVPSPPSGPDASTPLSAQAQRKTLKRLEIPLAVDYVTGVANVAHKTTQQHLDDASLYVPRDKQGGPPCEMRTALINEITAWIASVQAPTNDEQKLEHRYALRTLRNLNRLSRDWSKELLLDVILDVYETQRAELTNFTPTPEFSDLRAKLGTYQGAKLVQKTPHAIFIDMAVFHRRTVHKAKANSQPAPRPVPTAGPYLNYGQFLKVLNALGQYPQVLYALGLAFDVVATQTADWSTATSMWLELDPPSTIALRPDRAQPRTRVQFGKMSGVTAPFPQDAVGDDDHKIKDGYLVLSGCEVVDYDVDAIGLGTIQHADNPLAQPQDGAGGAVSPPANTPSVATLPMKSGGLTLVPAEIPGTVQSRSDKQKGYIDMDGEQLFFTSTDLVRGYAPEVIWRGKTFSLTARTDVYSYRKSNGDIVSLLDAGEVRDHAIQLEAAYAPDAGEKDGAYNKPSRDMHIAPSLMRWNGWSMLLKNPFDTADQSKSTKTQANGKKELKFPVRPSHGAPVKDNKLPAKRFGEEYSFQIPGIDIAGNRLASPDGVKPSVVTGTYLRHDPIAAPALLAEARFDPSKSPGEQIDVMVARLEDSDYQPLRYLCPPVGDLQSLIDQGALDDEDGNLRSPIDDGRKKGVGSFADVNLDAYGDFPVKIIPPEITSCVPLPTSCAQHVIPIYEVPRMDIPSGAYLPDSYANKACFQLVDVATGAMYLIDPVKFYARADDFSIDDPQRRDYLWPRAEHIQVQLTTFSTSEPAVMLKRKAWNPLFPNLKNTRLEIDVPAGWQMELQMSCAPNRRQAKNMATIRLAEQALKTIAAQVPTAKVTKDDVEKLLLNGMSAIYTPYKPIGLVAAVKRPRHESYVADNTLTVSGQAPDSALATFSGNIHVEDGRATGMLDVYLEWDEYSDDPSKPAPAKQHQTQHLGQYANVPVNALWRWKPGKSGDIANELPFGAPTAADLKTSFKFPDARHRKVSVRVDSVSRFVSYYISTNGTNAATTCATTPPAGAPAEVQTAQFTLPGTTLASASVLNTTQPSPLNITRIKPLFPASAGRTTQHIFGGAMRVHIGRGILSSGEEPRIGVVVVDDGADQCGPIATKWLTDPVLSRLYTRWGLDPARDNTGADTFTPAPSASHFTPASPLPGFDTPVKETAYLAEKQDTKATILTYRPLFTPEDGWYCDIMLNRVPAYNCFLRLAMVLYQDQSLDNKKVSTVSLAAFVQLRADRTMMLLPTKTKHQLVLAIDGTRPGLDFNGTTTSFTVSVEIHDHGVWISDPDMTICAVSAQCPQPPLEGTNPPAAASHLAEYVITITKHYHRERRLRVEEFEARRTYDPVTLADVIGPPALTYAMEPMLLPHL